MYKYIYLNNYRVQIQIRFQLNFHTLAEGVFILAISLQRTLGDIFL